MNDADDLYGALGGPPRRTPAAKSVLTLLKRLISEGDLKPGQRLPNERELAERLGVSRPSLREGVRALAAMNILVVRQGDGVYVSSLDPELLAEPLQLILAIDSSAIYALFEVRRITEPVAASLAAQRATTEELERLQEEMKLGVAAQNDDAALVEHDTRFHRVVHQAAHNPFLLSVSASLAGVAHKARQRTVKLPRNGPLTLDEHQAIADAIFHRRPQEAKRAMLLHLRRVENDLRGQFDAPGNQPS